MGIIKTVLECFSGAQFTLKEAYGVNPDCNPESVRARIYENLGVMFERVGRGVYVTKDLNGVIIEGDGRDLSCLEDRSIDCIITDHPWLDKKSNYGGNRNFANYACFEYTLEDFKEKARVLKDGSFLCECLPAENENNFDYLYRIKKLAEEAGFRYYAKVSWKKGTFVSNTGRKAKNSEDIMIFSKGTPRSLLERDGKMLPGTHGMLPTEFNVQAVSRMQKCCQSQKPVALFEQLLEFVTLEGEVVLDQFVGSGSVGVACQKRRRKFILFEKMKDRIWHVHRRIGNSVPLITVKGELA